MKIVKTRSVYSNQKMNTIVQFCYGAKLNLHNGSKFGRKKLIWFQNFYYIKKAAIVSNFCLIGKIPHDFLTLTSIELACKTFIGIQVKISIECAGNHQKMGTSFVNINAGSTFAREFIREIAHSDCKFHCCPFLYVTSTDKSLPFQLSIKLTH